MDAAQLAASAAGSAGRIPIGRIPTPDEEVASLIAFLVSGDARYIAGEAVKR